MDERRAALQRSFWIADSTPVFWTFVPQVIDVAWREKLETRVVKTKGISVATPAAVVRGHVPPINAKRKFSAVQMIDVMAPTTDRRELQLTHQPEPDLKLLLDKLRIELPVQRRQGSAFRPALPTPGVVKTFGPKTGSWIGSSAYGGAGLQL
ncbi:MAG: hypothetical protein J2P50_13305 [Hyphomicrobiaceae bacterium]|nr:hypothetical protein [Hyphomicrobiaceae bacterium]